MLARLGSLARIGEVGIVMRRGEMRWGLKCGKLYVVDVMSLVGWVGAYGIRRF